MTYHNKLILKKVLKIVIIVLAIILVIAFISFTYLSRYLVFTEDGASFSFRGETAEETTRLILADPPASPVLTIGEEIEANDVVDEIETVELTANEIDGVFIPYTTLQDDGEINAIDLTDAEFNTLVLEMQSSNTDILSSNAINNLITRATNAGIHLVAMISCLDNSSFALSNTDCALSIGGALWMSDSGYYWLDPSQEKVQQMIVSQINSLKTLGFEEVILKNFYFPDSDSIVYSLDEDMTYAQLTAEGYQAIADAIGDSCRLSVYIPDTTTENQLSGTASRFYVVLEDGGDAVSYADSHPDDFIVFMTSSHDTRFDNYGKVSTSEYGS